MWKCVKMGTLYTLSFRTLRTAVSYKSKLFLPLSKGRKLVFPAHELLVTTCITIDTFRRSKLIRPGIDVRLRILKTNLIVKENTDVTSVPLSFDDTLNDTAAISIKIAKR